MAKPQSLADFLAVVEKSNLLDLAKLPAVPPDPHRPEAVAELADRLVADGLLTRFQADNLLKGRWAGYVIGPYKVLDKIGAGANGQVYLCEHLKMRRRVAMKVLQAEKALHHEAVKRFEREAMAAAAIRHPNIVHAFDLGREGRLHYLVMEFVDGESLLKKLSAGGRLPPREAAGLMAQAAAGLQTAHDHGVIHRDVKPSNLMITKDGQVKLLDLGLARYAADEVNLTNAGDVLGLAGYIAPEQALSSKDVDARADVYGLGATFYLAVTGKKPPPYGEFAPPGPRNAGEKVDYDRLLAVLRRAMALNPDDRYQSATEVAVALGPLTPPPAVRARTRPEIDLTVDSRSRPELSLTPPPTPPLSEWDFDQPVRLTATIADQETTRAALDVTPAPSATFRPPPRAAKTVARPTRRPPPRPVDRPAGFDRRWLSWAFLAVAVVLFLAAVGYTIWG